MKLEGKTAIVTGGNSGIGRAVAQELADQGAHVVIFGRNKETLEEARQHIGNGTVAVQGDVANLDDLDRLLQATKAQVGDIDILVVNAGVADVAPLDQVTETHYDKVMDINVKGAYFTVQKAVPHLNDGAAVLLVTSVVNEKGFPSMSVYAASKAAVRSLARSFSAELLPRGIRVNALSPGPISTPIYGRMGLPAEMQDGFAQQLTELNPMGRFGTPEEVAKAALYLVSSDASYVAGVELAVDGGFSQL